MNIETRKTQKTTHWNFPIKKQIPNLLTILRIFLVIPISLLLLNQNFLVALSLILLAAISDGLDGYIAKKTNSVTKIGSILDPIADKLLLASGFMIMTYLGQIPFWLCVLVVMRDLIIIAAVTGYFLVSDSAMIKPSLISKINTLFQILFILYLVSVHSLNLEMNLSINPDNSLKITLIALVATTTIISGLDYAVRWIKQAYHNIKTN